MPCNPYRDTIAESGGVELGVGAVADGEYLKRVGSEIVGAAAGGSYTPEVIVVYDNLGGTMIGAPVAVNLIQVNTAPGNYTLPGGGWVNIATTGSYLVRYSVGFNGQAPNAISNYQSVLQTSPTGLGAWVNVIGSDAYAERVNPAGRIGSMVGESGIVVPPGGLDVQIMTVLVVGSPAMAQAQASRLVIERVA